MYIYFLSCGGWKSIIRVPPWLDSLESSLCGLQMTSFSLYTHMWQREGKGEGEGGETTGLCSGVSLYKHTNPIMGALSSWSHLNLIKLNYLPKTAFQTPSHWGLEFQHMNLVVRGRGMGCNSVHSILRLALQNACLYCMPNRFISMQQPPKS